MPDDALFGAASTGWIPVRVLITTAEQMNVFRGLWRILCPRSALDKTGRWLWVGGRNCNV